MIKWIWSKLTGQRLVYLRDFDGEVTLTFERKTPFGYSTAKRWWPYWVGESVILLPDGQVKQPHYVKEWKYK